MRTEEILQYIGNETKKLIQESVETGYRLGQTITLRELENNLLSACENMTDEQWGRVEVFVHNFIKKYDRTPTISDCIEETLAEVWKEVHGFLDSIMHEENGKLVNNFGEPDYEYLKKCLYRIYSKDETENTNQDG